MFPNQEWMKKYLEMLNQDKELNLYGKHFNLIYAIETDGNNYNIEVKNGKFVLASEGSLTPELVFKTSSNHWKNFSSFQPIPTYTDLLGAAAYGNVEIIGEIKIVWANIRSLWRTIEIMRKVGEENQ